VEFQPKNYGETQRNIFFVSFVNMPLYLNVFLIIYRKRYISLSKYFGVSLVNIGVIQSLCFVSY